MFKVVVAHSEEFDTLDAVDELLQNCETELDGNMPNAGLLFAGSDYEPQLLLDRILERYPALQLIGCTTDGEMSSQIGYTEDSVTLSLFCSDVAKFAAGVADGAGEDPDGAAERAVAMARAVLDGEPKLAITLPDGLSSTADRVLGALGKTLGKAVPVVGGMSADRVGGTKVDYATHQFCGNRVLSNSVPVLLFGGQILSSLGVESGWSPIGKRMTVTRAQGQTLFELDGQPALEFYRHYLGDITNENLAGLGAYPLAVYEQGLDRYFLRVANHADPETGEIHFLGEIPEGAEVQITQAIRQDVVAGAGQSVQNAVSLYPGESPSAALLFSCTGRKLALGTRTRDEVRLARDTLSASVPMCGFYTFGEIGPLSDISSARYHNTTFVTLLIGSQ